MSTPKTLHVTSMPPTKPAKTSDGRCTGMLITLSDAVAYDDAAKSAIKVPAGTIVSRSLAGGYHSGIGDNYTARKIGTDGKEISFRA